MLQQRYSYRKDIEKQKKNRTQIMLQKQENADI